MKFPEHEKLKAIQHLSQALGEFIDMGPYTLCEYREAGTNDEPEYLWSEDYKKDHPETTQKREPRNRDFIYGHAIRNPAYYYWDEGYYPVTKSIQKILAEYFDIDLDLIEQEKRQMLDQIGTAASRENA